VSSHVAIIYISSISQASPDQKRERRSFTLGKDRGKMGEEEYWEGDAEFMDASVDGPMWPFSQDSSSLFGVLRYATMAILGFVAYSVYNYYSSGGKGRKGGLFGGDENYLEGGGDSSTQAEADFHTYDVDNQDPNYNGAKATLSCIPFDCPCGRISAATAIDPSNGFLYVYGGETESDLLRGLSVYDAQNVSWNDVEVVSANPGQRSQAQMVVVEDLVVLYGGICNPQERGDCVDPAMYIFHIESRQWLQVDCTAAAFESAQAAQKKAKDKAQSGDKGEAGDDIDAESSALTIARKLQPPARCGHSMNVWRRHTLVVFGGYSEEGYYGDTWSFDLMQLSDEQKEEKEKKQAAGEGIVKVEDERVQWKQIHNAAQSHTPPPRGHHGAVVVGDELIVIGGEDETGASSLVAPGEIEILDLESQMWRVVATTGEGPEMCPGMHCHEMAETGKVLVISGENAGVFNRLYMLDLTPPSPTWSCVRVDWRGDWTMIPGIRTHYNSAVDCIGGSVLVFGGESSTGMMHDSLLALDVAKIMELPELEPEEEPEEEATKNEFSGPSALRKKQF